MSYMHLFIYVKNLKEIFLNVCNEFGLRLLRGVDVVC